MNQVYEKVLQFEEIYYIDVLASFKPLNTLITLLYINYIVRTLLLGLFITSNKLKIILEKVLNLLKSILSQYTFFGYRL